MLLEIAVRQARGFFLERAEAETGCTGLGEDEAAILKKQIAGVCASGSRGFGSELADVYGFVLCRVFGHMRSLR